MLSTATATMQPSDVSVDLATFQAAHATISSMRLMGQAGQLTVDIRYEPGHFTISMQAHSGPSTSPREMTVGEISGLREALEGDALQSVPGSEITALEALIHYLAQNVVVAQSSGRFDNVTFLDIREDASGVIVGSMRIGIDVIGLIHDDDGTVTVATRVLVMRKPGPFERLSKADRLSLAIALEKFIATRQPDPNPLWVDVLNDLQV